MRDVNSSEDPPLPFRSASPEERGHSAELQIECLQAGPTHTHWARWCCIPHGTACLCTSTNHIVQATALRIHSTTLHRASASSHPLHIIAENGTTIFHLGIIPHRTIEQPPRLSFPFSHIPGGSFHLRQIVSRKAPFIIMGSPYV